LSLKGRALPQEVRSLASPFTICGRQSGIGTDFSPRTTTFPSQYNSTKTLELICIFTPLLEEEPADEAWEPLKKKNVLPAAGEHWKENYFHVIFAF